MADQEFLASFAVEIDEAGVSRLQAVLAENRDLAREVAEAFSAATAAIREYGAEYSGGLPGLSGAAAEGAAGSLTGPAAGIDLSRAESDLQAFIAKAKQPIRLTANASGITSAARSAYEGVRALFASPVTIRARVEREDGGPPLKMSSGGRFTRPTDVQVAEDGDAEYIIPVKKEARAVPLLRQLLSELSPAARESLEGGADPIPAGVAAGSAGAGSVTRIDQNVSAPVSIQVHASGADGEEIGRGVYDAAERYLLRTLRSVL